MRVLIQLRHSPPAHAAATTMTAAPHLTAGIVQKVAGLNVDAAFPPVQVPGVIAMMGGRPRAFSLAPAASPYVVRGDIPDGATHPPTLASLAAQPDVVGVYADPVIESCPICPGDPAKGSYTDVAEAFGASGLHAAGMTGKGVYLAIVDTGVNLAHLQAKGLSKTTL